MILAFDVWAHHGTWGLPSLTASNTGIRDTQLHPGKAAVVGILGAALGQPRESLPDLAKRVRTACRTDAQPSYDAVYDYEATRRVFTPQADNPDAPRTTRFEEMRALELLPGGRSAGSIISSRQYWTAGGWTVFVSAEADLLSALRNALASPRMQLYAGRRVCPLAFPPDPQILDVESLVRAAALRPPLQKRAEPALREAVAGWRLCCAGPLRWEEGFPGAPAPIGRVTVRQVPIAPPRPNDNKPRHLLRLFAEHIECFAPGGTSAAPKP